MKVTEQFEIIVENEDDVSALQLLIRPMEFSQCVEAYDAGDKTLWDRLGFYHAHQYPAQVILGAQNQMLFFPVKKAKSKKK